MHGPSCAHAVEAFAWGRDRQVGVALAGRIVPEVRRHDVLPESIAFLRDPGDAWAGLSPHLVTPAGQTVAGSVDDVNSTPIIVVVRARR